MVNDDARLNQTCAQQTIMTSALTHPCAQIFLGVLELELLGDGDAIVADDRRASLSLDQHRFRPRAESHAHGIRKLAGTPQDLSRAAERKRTCLKAINEILPAAGITAQLQQCRCHSGTHPVCYIDKDHPGPGLQLVRIPAPAVVAGSAPGCPASLVGEASRSI